MTIFNKRRIQASWHRLILFSILWQMAALQHAQTFLQRRRSQVATGNTSSNLGWLAVVIFLIIAAYLFWTKGPGQTWFSSVLQAPTSISP
jgi:hypothetical protein